VPHPFLKWFPADEEADTGFMSVSLATRQVWKHMIRVMMEAEPYGFFVGRTGEPIDLIAFSRRIGASAREVRKAIEDLLNAGVPSRDSQGRLFCRRLVRDEGRRQQLYENGLRGDPARPSKDTPGPLFGGAKAGPSSPPTSAPASLYNPEAQKLISDSLRSSALAFGEWPEKVEDLRRLALLFVAEFANCQDATKAEKHLGPYTATLATMRSRNVSIALGWQACADAREANGGKPIWAALIKTAVSFLPSRSPGSTSRVTSLPVSASTTSEQIQRETRDTLRKISTGSR
jgi:hypothetical protein